MLVYPFPDSEKNDASLTKFFIHFILDESSKNVSNVKSLKSFKLSCQLNLLGFSRNKTICSSVIDQIESKNLKKCFSFRYSLSAFNIKNDIR